MSYHDSNHTGFAVFCNKQNLVFSLPLIALCSIYAYLKFIPLHIGLPIVGVIGLLYKITSSLKVRAIERKERKIIALDDDLMKELAADEILKETKAEGKAAKKQAKAESKARQRIATEKKAKKSSQEEPDNDDDNENLAMFAKGARNDKKKKA